MGNGEEEEKEETGLLLAPQKNKQGIPIQLQRTVLILHSYGISDDVESRNKPAELVSILLMSPHQSFTGNFPRYTCIFVRYI